MNLKNIISIPDTDKLQKRDDTANIIAPPENILICPNLSPSFAAGIKNMTAPRRCACIKNPISAAFKSKTSDIIGFTIVDDEIMKYIENAESPVMIDICTGSEILGLKSSLIL